MPAKRKRATRRSRVTRAVQNSFINTVSNEKCSHCGAIKRRHRLCLSCGFYKGKNLQHLIK